MYTIIQLNDKSLPELLTIAQELGIKKADSYKKEELVYIILDEQAIAGATKKVAAEKTKEERNDDKKKRSRINVKKEGPDKVFTTSKVGGQIKTEKVSEKAKSVTTNNQPVASSVTPQTPSQKEAPITKPQQNVVLAANAPINTEEKKISNEQTKRKKTAKPAKKNTEKNTAEKKVSTDESVVAEKSETKSAEINQ